MAEKVKVLGIKREKGWLYFVDKDGDVSRAKKGKTPKKEATEAS